MDKGLPAWSGPLIVSAILLPIIGGFLLEGPALGLAVGALVTAIAMLPRGALRASWSDP